MGAPDGDKRPAAVRGAQGAPELSGARQPLKVLFVEDSADDTELEVRELRACGYDVSYERVDTPQALRAALGGAAWDAVISDFNMPALTGLEALKLVRSLRPDVPFILVSGAMGEDAAVDAIKAGADDYVIKGNIVRLRSAMPRELRAAQARREMKRAQVTQQLLARCGKRLAQNIEYDATLLSVASIALPQFADWSVVDIVQADEAVRRITVAHVLADKQPAAQQLLERHPPGRLPLRVIRTNNTELVEVVTPSVLDQLAGNPELRELLLELGIESLIVSPLRARGQTFGALTFVSAQTHRRYSPADAELADELASRAALAIDNAALYKKAQDAIRVRDEFLSVASHELRTPITSLQLLLQSFVTGGGDRNASTEPELSGPRAERALRNMQRLSALVENLLDVSRMSSERMSLDVQELDLAQLAHYVLERHRDQALSAQCEIRLHATEPVWGRWDRGRLQQLLGNLLSNSIKYAPGKPIDVTVERATTGVRLTVVDRGVGVPKEAQARIFGRFERAAPIHHYGGLGLGLYVSRRIVEAHGGSIEMVSEPGAGTVVEVQLPLAPPGRAS